MTNIELKKKILYKSIIEIDSETIWDKHGGRLLNLLREIVPVKDRMLNVAPKIVNSIYTTTENDLNWHHKCDEVFDYYEREKGFEKKVINIVDFIKIFELIDEDESLRKLTDYLKNEKPYDR